MWKAMTDLPTKLISIDEYILQKGYFESSTLAESHRGWTGPVPFSDIAALVACEMAHDPEHGFVRAVSQGLANLRH
jgi:predicted cobalt transporter CbtA